MSEKQAHVVEYESGLEVAALQRWRNSQSYPEVASSPDWDDKKTATMPQVLAAPPPASESRRSVSEFSPQTEYQYSSFPPSEAKTVDEQETICGVRKKIFYFVLGIGVLIAVTAIAAGVGAGIAFGKKNPSKTSVKLHLSPMI
jgi:hypothetical protein